MEEVEMVDVFIAGVRWSVPQPVYESILATQAELAGQTERENAYEARIEQLEHHKDVLLRACQAAYRKHHMGDESIGWHELSDILGTALPEVMGDKEFQAWPEANSDGE